MTVQHTPTPWRIAGKGTIRYGDSRDLASGWIGSVHWRNRDANAAFIVRACNAHDELVAALRLVQLGIHVGKIKDQSLLPPSQPGDREINVISLSEIIDAALAKAEARS